MLSLTLARQLKQAGLEWVPRLHDIFIVPDRGLDDNPFVLTDVMTYIDIFRGSAMVTFHGTAEWALDYVLQTEAVWIPTEEQLRVLLRDEGVDLTLSSQRGGYRCEIHDGEEVMQFDAADAADAYGSALLHRLWRRAAAPGAN